MKAILPCTTEPFNLHLRHYYLDESIPKWVEKGPFSFIVAAELLFYVEDEHENADWRNDE